MLALIEHAQRLGEYIPFWNKLYFLRALLRVWRKPYYDAERMERKVSYRHPYIQSLQRLDDQVRNLEEVYNYRAGPAEGGHVHLYP